jgi:SAM-dependent methyltransferase
MEDQKLKEAIRESYAAVANQEASCCTSAGCGCTGIESPAVVSKNIGYSDNEIKTVPEGSNLGLGCGNPTAIASLKEGETVLDLGSGAGFDSFIAAKKVGETGKVIGVDMTPEMISKARRNAQKGEYGNVEFRFGEIENLPVADSSVNVVISNCVINLSTNKERTFQEAYRVLKPGGRLMISDIVLSEELPDTVRKSIAAYTGCISGAVLKEQYIGMIKKVGFKDVEIMNEFNISIPTIAESVISATVKGTKN